MYDSHVHIVNKSCNTERLMITGVVPRIFPQGWKMSGSAAARKFSRAITRRKFFFKWSAYSTSPLSVKRSLRRHEVDKNKPKLKVKICFISQIYHLK